MLFRVALDWPAVPKGCPWVTCVCPFELLTSPGQLSFPALNVLWGVPWSGLRSPIAEAISGFRRFELYYSSMLLTAAVKRALRTAGNCVWPKTSSSASPVCVKPRLALHVPMHSLELSWLQVEIRYCAYRRHLVWWCVAHICCSPVMAPLPYTRPLRHSAQHLDGARVGS